MIITEAGDYQLLLFLRVRSKTGIRVVLISRKFRQHVHATCPIMEP